MANVKITQLPQGTPQLTDQLAGVDTTGTPTTKKFLFGDQVDFIGTMIQNQDFTYGLTTGTSTAYVVGFDPVITTLQDGQLFLVQFNTDCGNSPTIDIDGLGALPMIDQAGDPLTTGAIPVGGSYGLIAISNGGTTAMLITQYPIGGFAVSPAEIQAQAFTYAVDSSTGPNAYAVNFTPDMTTSNGSRFDVLINATGTNTTTNPTVTADGNTYNIVLNDGAGGAVTIGDILAGSIASFELVSGAAALLNPQTIITSGVTPPEVQNQAFTYSEDTGAADAYVGVYSPVIAPVAGTTVELKIANTNLTTSPTFNAGDGAHAITLSDGNLVAIGNIVAGMIAIFIFDGTDWQLMNPFDVFDVSPPTVQKFTSGSGTYTTPDGVVYIRVTMCGGGGGGSGAGSAGSGSGGTGGTSTFGTTLLSCVGGGGGTANAAGGTGGTASLGTGPIGTVLTGGGGGGSQHESTFGSGSQGGTNPFGGQGLGALNAAGGDGVANTGGGAGGGGVDATGLITGSGGGAGGYVNAIITSPDATYAYTVGAGGTAGTAGTNGSAGGVGGTGYIIVEEYYHAAVGGGEVNPGDIQNQSFTFSTDSGVADAYVGTYTPAPSIVAGTTLLLQIANANLTTTPTFDCGDGGGPRFIVNVAGGNVVPGSLIPDLVAIFTLNTSNQWQLINPMLTYASNVLGEQKWAVSDAGFAFNIGDDQPLIFDHQVGPNGLISYDDMTGTFTCADTVINGFNAWIVRFQGYMPVGNVSRIYFKGLTPTVGYSATIIPWPSLGFVIDESLQAVFSFIFIAATNTTFQITFDGEGTANFSGGTGATEFLETWISFEKIPNAYIVI